MSGKLSSEFRKLQATQGNDPILCSRMHFGQWAWDAERLEEKARTDRAISKVSSCLVDGWSLSINVQEGYAGVQLFNPSGHEVAFSSNRTCLADELEDAFDYVVNSQIEDIKAGRKHE